MGLMVSGNGWLYNALLYHQLMLTDCHLQKYKTIEARSQIHVSNIIASSFTIAFHTTRQFAAIRS